MLEYNKNVIKQHKVAKGRLKLSCQSYLKVENS